MSILPQGWHAHGSGKPLEIVQLLKLIKVELLNRSCTAKALRRSPVEQVWLLLEEKQIPYNVKRAALFARAVFSCFASVIGITRWTLLQVRVWADGRVCVCRWSYSA